METKLFALDNTKDSGATNIHGKEQAQAINWQAKLNACNNLSQLSDLFAAHETTIGGDKSILNLFSNRKQQLQK